MGKIQSNADFSDAISKFADAIYSTSLVERPDGEQPFSIVSLQDDYLPEDAIKLLLDTTPSFFGHKEATFAGFASWVVAPEDPNARLELIGLCIKELLAKAELSAANYEGLSYLEQDLVARYIVAGPQFIEQIYGGIAGMDILSEFGSRLIADHIFESEKRGSYTLMKMMASCHYVADIVPNDEDTVHPSVNKSVTSVRKFIDPKILSRASIYPQWAKCRGTIAFLYSANSIAVGDRTLLDALHDGTASFAEHGGMFNSWMSRARFFCEHVLRRLPDEEVFELNVRSIRELDAERFERYALSTQEMMLTRTVYNIKE